MLIISVGCPVGEYYDKIKKTCTACEINTYQDVVGAHDCKICAVNTKTVKTGTRTKEECVPV